MKIVLIRNYEFNEPQAKNRGFKEFLLRRNPSKSFADKYVTYLKSNLVRNMTRQVIGNNDIYNASTIKQLNEIYHLVKGDDANIRLHNIYSGVVSAYIKYIIGNELRKRVSQSDESKNGQ